MSLPRFGILHVSSRSEVTVIVPQELSTFYRKNMDDPQHTTHSRSIRASTYSTSTRSTSSSTQLLMHLLSYRRSRTSQYLRTRTLRAFGLVPLQFATDLPPLIALSATSILVSRFILNLRDAASGTAPDLYDSLFPFDESWRPTTNSISSFLEPLGAPLDHSLSVSSIDDDHESVVRDDLLQDDLEMVRWMDV